MNAFLQASEYWSDGFSCKMEKYVKAKSCGNFPQLVLQVYPSLDLVIVPILFKALPAMMMKNISLFLRITIIGNCLIVI